MMMMGKDKGMSSYDMPIPQYSMRGHIMRKKWKKANVSTSPPTSFNKMMIITCLLMISALNLCSCVGGSELVVGGGVSSPGDLHSESHSIIKREIGYVNATSTSIVGGDGDGSPSNSSSHMTWIIERKECGQLEDGCICESRSRNTTVIRCRCNDHTQIAHLKPPGRVRDIKHSSLFVQKEHWTWRFEHCSAVVLHPDFLATVDGSHFQVEFFNITQFNIQESAFATRDSYSSHGSPTQVSILFNQCVMDSLPTKTFPSYVHSIRFLNCNIKSLARRFIYALKMDLVTIEGSKIDNIDSEAFYSQTIIDTLTVLNSTIISISRNGVASAINKMIWMGSMIQVLQEDALSGSVATVTIQDSEFTKVVNSGFVIKTWSKVTLSNNTFKDVARRGIDLAHYNEEDPSVEISGNSWGKVERDFIATGSSDTPFISVKNNTFLQQCDCGNTFVSYLSTNGSRVWFHQEILNNSRCPVNEKVLACLVQFGHVNSTDSNMLPYDALNLLCDSNVYMCMNEVREIGSTSEDSIPGTPQLPNRLRVLAYFIAAMGIFIIASLLVTMCVFLCRKKIPRKKSPSDGALQNLENAQGKKTAMPKSMSGGEYADIVFKHHQQNNTSASSRPRSVLLEDVEMEDKGVQTMPTELSSEVLEGLREKLSRPDSFWDAKETIDHLYDLIQVKELSSTGLSSPPDVTMCNDQSTTASTARLLPSSSSSPVGQITSAGVSVSIGGSDPQLHKSSPSNASSPVTDSPPPLPASSPPSGVPLIQRYAQIKNKVKTAPLCEYADPSDSSMHIYSELTPHLHHSERNNSHSTTVGTTMTTTSSPSNDNNPTSPGKLSQHSRELSPFKKAFLSAARRPFNNGPILCEYTDPKDVQTHVYAELSNNASQEGHKPTSSSVSAQSSPIKQPISHSHHNTITIAVPPPPISIPHSSSFHNSPRLLSKLKENELLSSSNPSLTTTVSTPVKIIHRSDVDNRVSSKSHPRLPLSEKLKRSASHVDSSPSRGGSSAASTISMLNAGGGRNGTTGSDTQKRPLPSIPSWSDRNEGKSQF